MPKKGGKRVFSLSFLDPSSPRLASGSSGPPNDFKVKEPARLGEPITSGLSLSSPGRAASPLKWPFAYINRRARGAEKGFQGLEGEGIERRQKEEVEVEVETDGYHLEEFKNQLVVMMKMGMLTKFILNIMKVFELVNRCWN